MEKGTMQRDPAAVGIAISALEIERGAVGGLVTIGFTKLKPGNYNTNKRKRKRQNPSAAKAVDIGGRRHSGIISSILCVCCLQ